MMTIEVVKVKVGTDHVKIANRLSILPIHSQQSAKLSKCHQLLVYLLILQKKAKLKKLLPPKTKPFI